MKIHSLAQDCWGCPSRWEARTEDDRRVVIYFRWGFLEVRVEENVVFGEQTSDGLDGILYEEEMLRLTGLELVDTPPVPDADERWRLL